MGLCGLCKKITTNQFCFEHKINVCEQCMVQEHSKCIVRSYLLWLQDYDYTPICALCNENLGNQECIRLLCYDVFHWSCLDNYARGLPSNTAPAGYACPTCQTCIFPQPNLISPVADVLRSVLAGVNWARTGLGLPLLEEMMAPPRIQPMGAENPSLIMNNHVEPAPRPVENHQSTTKNHIHSFPDNREYLIFDSGERSALIPPDQDRDENKYKRRSPMQLIQWWLKSKFPARSHSRDPLIIYKRWIILGLLIFIGFCTLMLIFIRVGRASADKDPLLDLHLNPNIRVEDRMAVNE